MMGGKTARNMQSADINKEHCISCISLVIRNTQIFFTRNRSAICWWWPCLCVPIAPKIYNIKIVITYVSVRINLSVCKKVILFGFWLELLSIAGDLNEALLGISQKLLNLQ
jgi:hypothetical protein